MTTQRAILCSLFMSVLGCDATIGSLDDDHTSLAYGVDDSPNDVDPPKPAVGVAGHYDVDTHEVTFSWSWGGEHQAFCDCPQVGYCRSDNTSSEGGHPCQYDRNPPFWWQLVNETRQERLAAEYRSGLRSTSISCDGREGETLRIDVDTRDAAGNICGESNCSSAWVNVRSARVTCPERDTSAPAQPSGYVVYSEELDRIQFSWSWLADEGFGRCDEFARTELRHHDCDATHNPPFLWAIRRDPFEPWLARVEDNEFPYFIDGSVTYSSSLPGHASLVWVDCFQHRGKTIELSVRARDAVGNVSPERRLSAVCPESN